MKLTRTPLLSRFIISVAIISTTMVLDYLLGYLGGASELCNIHDMSGQVTLVVLTLLSLIMAMAVGQIITGTKASRSVRIFVFLAGILLCAAYYGYGIQVCKTGRQGRSVDRNAVRE